MNSSLSDRLNNYITKHGSADLMITDIELSEISNCERCGGPVNKIKLINGSPENSCRCDYCGDSIFKNIVIFNPERDYYSYWSVSNSFDNMVSRELNR